MIGILLAALLSSETPVPFTSFEPQDAYAFAYHGARERGLDLVIHFRGPHDWVSIDSPEVQAALERFVYLEVPHDFPYGAGAGRLIDHPAFREMQGYPGLCIVSLSRPQERFHGYVVSVHPFRSSRYRWVPRYGAREIQIILDMPPGTLSQRSMLYAVRVHPERPQSVWSGTCHTAFLRHCERHSYEQARLCNQHHADIVAVGNRLRSEVGWFSTASEVVAESWGLIATNWGPEENVLEAAFSCVDAWRQSPGHWSAVAGSHRFYGYDICRSRSGIWYGTGVFGR